jgi:hypothetical protein
MTMNPRLLLIGGAAVLSAAVLGATLLLGDPGPTAPGGAEARAPRLDGRGISATDLDDPDASTLQPVEAVRDFELFREDPEDGSVTRFAGAEVTPQADFIADVVRPTAEVRFAPHRMLVVTADAGRFYHPGNVPTRGDFHTGTVVTLYRAPEGTPVDPTSDRHVQMRVYLDEATQFDRQRGHILSAGPVTLVAPDLHFTGRGLDLTFNSLADRIERLTITEGDQLRLAQNSPLSPTGDEPGPVEQAAPTDHESAETPSAEAASAVVPGQSYHAVLRQAVRVQVGEQEAELAGDRLDLVFNLDRTPDDTLSQSPPHEAHPAAPGASPQGHQPWDGPAPVYINNVVADSAAADSGGDRRLMPESPDDIVVRWAGPLELRPLSETAPDDLPGPLQNPQLAGPDDALLTLTGRPARIDTVRDEHVTARTVGYRSTAEQVFALGSPDHPLAVRAPDLGLLTGDRLEIDQARGTGELLGPGRLLTEDPQLEVDFSDRLDLAFAPDADGRLDLIDSATFVGHVHARTSPDNVDDPGIDPLDLTSHTLTLTVTRDADGNAQPSHLQAAGTADRPVVATQPTGTFQATQLDVDLAPPAESASVDVSNSEQSKINNQQSKITITRLRALGQVQVDRPDDQLTLTAHALDADPRINRLELFGQSDTDFATLTRGDDQLAGVHLILLEAQQAAEAVGPGTLSVRTDEADDTARLNVAWAEAMSFDNAEGTALFRGRVDAASTSATDDTALRAHSLALEFVPEDLDSAPAEGASAPVPPESPESPDPEPTADPSILDLRRAHALAAPDTPESRVHFVAQTFDAQRQNDRPLTRLTLESRELIFINQPPNLDNETAIDDHLTIEQVRVPVRGRLLLEDYRSRPPAEAASAAGPGDTSGEPSGGAVPFAGRGATLFAWEKQLILDAQTNDLRLEREVYMAHDPDPADDDPAQVLTLNAQRLVADLTETGGLGAYVAGAAPRAQVRRVNADGQVRVAQDTTQIVADHLEYIESQQNVLLWAEPRRQTLLTLDGRDLPAWGYRWDLPTDTFTALEPGTGVVPVE